jgi:uncharacterized protein YecA (UPF0149 family)
MIESLPQTFVHDTFGQFDEREVQADGRTRENEPEQQIQVTFRRQVAKVGRNDNCPCGSGKKYKKCCGQ